MRRPRAGLIPPQVPERFLFQVRRVPSDAQVEEWGLLREFRARHWGERFLTRAEHVVLLCCKHLFIERHRRTAPYCPTTYLVFQNKVTNICFMCVLCISSANVCIQHTCIRSLLQSQFFYSFEPQHLVILYLERCVGVSARKCAAQLVSCAAARRHVLFQSFSLIAANMLIHTLGVLRGLHLTIFPHQLLTSEV